MQTNPKRKKNSFKKLEFVQLPYVHIHSLRIYLAHANLYLEILFFFLYYYYTIINAKWNEKTLSG